MLRRVATIMAGFSVYAGATGAAYIYFADVPNDKTILGMPDEERKKIFDSRANEYDKVIGRQETAVGITLMRKFLMKHATGQVLEVGAGTGRNIKFYPNNTRVTITDISEGMLAAIPGNVDKGKQLTIDYRIMNAENLDFSDNSFDTVVNTFGICSVHDPVKMLKEMKRVCKMDGKILLLQHGRGHYSWINYVLDKYATIHAQAWGCIWNRPIEDIMAAAGIEIGSIHKFHFGTTYYIVAKPRQNKVVCASSKT